MTAPSAAHPADLSNRRVLDAACSALVQCEAMLDEVERAAYTAPCRRLFGSTIGQHVRHALDHFEAALTGFGAGTEIDYDHRERDTPVERDPAAALSSIRSLGERLSQLDEAGLDAPVRVRIMVNAEGHDAALGSTLARELAFAVHHAVHHNAMIASIAGELGIATPPGFGKAPSTVNHERATRTRGPGGSEGRAAR